MKSYMADVKEVAKAFECSESHAYKLIRQMNQELAAAGYMTVHGRVPRAYLATKIYGYSRR